MSSDTDSDKRERMQVLELAKECYAMKLDLLSSATVIDRAVKFVENHQNQNQNLGRSFVLLKGLGRSFVKRTIRILPRLDYSARHIKFGSKIGQLTIECLYSATSGLLFDNT